MAEPQRLFLSYARDDDEPFVKRLYEDLTVRGFSVWWDRISMPSRALTFLQEIRDAIETSDRLLVVIGPKAVESEYVRSEWQHGLLFAKGVVPIMRLGERQLLPTDLKKLQCPDCRASRLYEEALDELLRLLKKPIPELGPLLTMVPSLPPHFLPRLAEMQSLQGKILADIQRPTVITSARQTTGLWGIGGIGKTVLAAALARATETRRAFSDGILWLTLGAEDDGKQYDPLASMRAVGLALGDKEVKHYLDLQTAGNRLKQVLDSKVCLLILDDVWELGQATPFRNALGPRGRLLITTRQRRLVSNLEAQEHCLDVLSGAEARNLLAGWCDLALDELPPTAGEVANECGRLPLALSICGALARKGELWEDILQDLKNADLSALSVQLPDYPYDNAYKAMHVSVAYLERRDPAGARHYLELAVFPEDEAAPEAAVLTLWTGGNGLTERQGRRLLADLADLTLIKLTGEAPRRRVSLHDLQHDYLRARAGEALQGLQERLLAAYRRNCPGGWHQGPDDGYFFQRLPAHLMAAGREGELRDLLLDYRWLRAKLAAVDVYSLIRDYDYLAGDPDLHLLQGALRLSGHVLFQDKKQLAGQLTGRLQGFDHPAIKTFLENIKAEEQDPWLRPLTPNLTPPGGPLLRTLRDPTGGVNAVAVTPDGHRAVSGSTDWGQFRGRFRWDTFNVWDLETGQLRTLIPTSPVNALVVTPDRRWAISGSDDTTLKVWDLETGQVVRILTGHSGGVNAVALTTDGSRVVSGSADKTLKVWDLETGQELHTLTGHHDSVQAVAVFPDGSRVVSGSKDGGMSVWDIETGQLVYSPDYPLISVQAVAVLPDNCRVVSGSEDGIMRVWDLETRQMAYGFTGHTGCVTAVAVTRDGRKAVTSSRDKTLKVWDLETGHEIRTLRGHTGSVNAVAVILDGRQAVSASSDGTLKFWDLETQQMAYGLTGHTDCVTAVVVSPDGRKAVSGSNDGTLKVWDPETGKELHTLRGHTGSVNAVAVTRDGRKAVTSSRDKTLKLWDLETGERLNTLQTFRNSAVALSPDGRKAVCGSIGHNLDVWDLKTGKDRTLGEAEPLFWYEKISDFGEDLVVLEQCKLGDYWVNTVVVSPDGRKAVSGSNDTTLKVWDLETGKSIRTLRGHIDGVEMVALTPDGRRAVSASRDGTLKVWDLETGQELRTLNGSIQMTQALTSSGRERQMALKIVQELYGHIDGVEMVALTPDGRRAVSASRDGTLKVWDLEKSCEPTTLKSHKNMVSAVALTPSGRLAVSTSTDCSLKVWDLDTGECLTTFIVESRMTRCAVASKGRTIVAGDASGRIHFLRLEGVD